MNDPHWYVGPWQRDEKAEIPAWVPPAGTVGCLDLRSLPQMVSGGGQGVFLIDGPVADYELLGTGDPKDIKSSQAIRDRMPKREKNRAPQGDDLLSHLFDAICDGSDPTGDTFAKPLMPDDSLRVGMSIGPFSLQWKTAPWAYHWDKIQDVERADFQRCFDDSVSGRSNDKEHHRRVLDALCDKYGADDWKTFVPTKLRKSIPGRLKHETVFADDFNRADGALGTASGGFTWTLVQGTITVASNQAKGTGGSGIRSTARTQSDLSSADHYTQAVWPSGSVGSQGILARFVSTATNDATESYYLLHQAAATTHQLYKKIGASFTLLNNNSFSMSAGALMRLMANGSAITTFGNGVQQVTATDTAITGNLRTGIYGGTNNVIWDSYEYGDLTPSGSLYTQLERGVRGVSRGVYTHWQG